MSYLVTALVMLLTLLPLTSSIRCIACTSDPDQPNFKCLGGTNVTNPGDGNIDPNEIYDMSRNCTDPEAQYCFTKVTWEPPYLDNDNEIYKKV